MPAGFYVDPMVSSRAAPLVLTELLRARQQDVADHVAEQGIDLTVVTFPWYFTMFVEVVPTEVCLRVWDLLLLDGFVVLHQCVAGQHMDRGVAAAASGATVAADAADAPACAADAADTSAYAAAACGTAVCTAAAFATAVAWCHSCCRHVDAATGPQSHSHPHR